MDEKAATETTSEEKPQTESVETKATTEESVMVGGPGIGDDAPKNEATQGQDVGSYVTKDDLSAMEKRLIDAGLGDIARDAAQMKAVGEPKVVDEEAKVAQKIADLWFTDPTEALRLQKQLWQKELDAREQKQKTTSQFWDKFYDSNPVLRGQKKVVQFIMNENYAQLKDMPAHDAQKILAEKAKSFISEVATSTGGRIETLSSDKPEALRASGEPTPTVKPVQEKVVSFCDQVQNLHKKRMGLQK